MKTISKKNFGFLILFFATFIFGCSGTPMKITTAPDQQIDTTRGKMVSSKKCGFQLLLFIPIMVNSRHQRAYESLLAQSSGSVISNLRVEESWTYGLVGTAYCTEMHAVAYPKVTMTKQ